MSKAQLADLNQYPRWAKGVALVAVTATLVITVLSIRKYVKNKPPKVNYPHGGLGIPAGFDAKAYAEQAHKLMSGGTIMSVQRDMFLANIASLDTDDMFVSVYDAFNQLYMREGDGTLRKWVNSEYTLSPGVLAQLNARFARLNLQ